MAHDNEGLRSELSRVRGELESLSRQQAAAAARQQEAAAAAAAELAALQRRSAELAAEHEVLPLCSIALLAIDSQLICRNGVCQVSPDHEAVLRLQMI